MSKSNKKVVKDIDVQLSELPTTSSKIRFLNSLEMSRGDIARKLNIRYQHVRKRFPAIRHPRILRKNTPVSRTPCVENFKCGWKEPGRGCCGSWDERSDSKGMGAWAAPLAEKGKARLANSQGSL